MPVVDNRSRIFISRVRKRLKDANYDKFQDEEIYDVGNLGQTQIMLETGGIEKDFTIYLKSGIDNYDFMGENAFSIRRISPSWDGSIKYCTSPSVFEDYKNASSTYPVAMYIFNNKAYFYPAPSSDGDTILIWALQNEVITPMDDDVEPELPSKYDMALIYWTIAELAPEISDPKGMAYFQLYENQLDLIKRKINNKVSITKQMEDNL